MVPTCPHTRKYVRAHAPPTIDTEVGFAASGNTVTRSTVTRLWKDPPSATPRAVDARFVIVSSRFTATAVTSRREYPALLAAYLAKTSTTVGIGLKRHRTKTTKQRSPSIYFSVLNKHAKVGVCTNSTI